MTLQADFMAAAEEEIDRAVELGWANLARVTPWGDTFEGFTPQGRAVCFERTYLWAYETGGDIHVEVAVYEARAYEDGVTITRAVSRQGRGSNA